MARFKVEVFKAYQGEQWGNVYLIEAAGLAEAINAAGPIADMDQAMHKPRVTQLYARVSDVQPGTDVFATIPLNRLGTGNSNGTSLPLYCTCRVDLQVQGGGRPSRKYFRMPIEEGDQVDGSLTSTFLGIYAGVLQGGLNALSSAGVQFVDPDGQAIVNAVIYPNVQMRQLHRRRKRSAAAPAP